MSSQDSIAAGRNYAPEELVLVRHGQSVGNVADAAARDKGLGRLGLTTRDADTPLSDTGREQAEALGRHLVALARPERPQVVLASPYERAAHTARLATAQLADLPLVTDERLRERDLGVFDGMTGTGIRAEFPEEAARRGSVGKFYYRPPGGESWTDVALRVRSVLADIRQEYDGERVWVFSHQAVIMSFRLVLEGLDERRLLEIDGSEPLANCSLTTYRRGDAGALELVAYAATAHLEASPAETTHEEPHAPVGGEPRG